MYQNAMKNSALAIAATLFIKSTIAFADTTPADVIQHYADLACAKYSDSLIAAQALDASIYIFLTNPSEANLDKAKAAWLAARIPYQQTEAYRFGNAIVDDWEGRVNAWSLDEGLIDYVDASYGTQSDENSLYVVNVIANPWFMVDGKTIDASTITTNLIQNKLQ